MNSPMIMWTITEIARRDGISKQAVSKAVRRLVEGGDLPVERNGAGNIVRVSVAHYDHARERFSDPSRLSQPATVAPPIDPTEAAASRGQPRATDSFDEARRQEMWLRVSREKLRRQEAAKLLVRADLLAEALGHSGRTISAVIARLPNRADDLALALSQEGVHGVRTKLREIAFDLATQIADALDSIGVQAPEGDDGLAAEDEAEAI
jgi:DNA-binding Lrp family transcriptional regulator